MLILGILFSITIIIQSYIVAYKFYEKGKDLSFLLNIITVCSDFLLYAYIFERYIM